VTAEAARPLLDQQVAQRVATLRLRARRAVEGLRSGIHRSPHRGASVIFAEHREYRPGDDPRLLDWRAFARSDRDTIKRFEQETHLRAHLLLDVSPSMDYPDAGRIVDVSAHKRTYAATVLAAMAFVLLGQGDAVGALTFDRKVLDALPSRARPGQLDAILELLAGAPQGTEQTALEAALNAIGERVGRRGLVVLASDLLDMGFAALDPLTHLRALGHDVIVFHVLHAEELDFPFTDRMRVFDPETNETLDTDPGAVREAYLAQMRQLVVRCRQRCTSAGARYALARTDAPVQQVIAQVLRGRAKPAWG
jgi:uncharacterized protein (DUF58 family)